MRKLILKLRLRMLLLLTLTYIGVALVSILIFWFFTPPEYFRVYPAIDVFYWLCGVGMTYFLDLKRANHPDKLLSVFMTFRGIKFLLTIALLIVGIKVFDMPRVTFAISLMCNYFVYSALELYIYFRYNKRITTGKWD